MLADILKIDNLWIMANSLTRLKLSNNAIEKIENLDCLVHLVDLDLSFNHIKIIENLESLVKLEVLLLYSNEIEQISGIDGLTELTIFSIGANRIDDWDHVIIVANQQPLMFDLNTLAFVLPVTKIVLDREQMQKRRNFLFVFFSEQNENENFL